MKIASFTFKGKHYIITSSDWFWGKVRKNKLMAAIIVLALVVAYIFMPQKPEEPVIMTIEPIQKPVEKIKKQATNKIATQAIDTPVMPVIGIPITVETPIVKQPSIDDGFAREFDNQLSNFESKL